MASVGSDGISKSDGGVCTMSGEYRHPVNGEGLKIGNDRHLYDSRGLLAFPDHEGTYDFVVDAPSQTERAHYDSTYALGGWWGGTTLNAVDYDSLWTLEPCSQAYLRSLGDLRGKKILLIGNGTSVKEFLFVLLGAHVTFTDLSFQGVMYAKRQYLASRLGIERPNDCEFHAVNAYYLPFGDNAFDIVCADAVIHHMDDLKSLFAGIKRCLRPGGYCRFADTAYSSWWQGAKATVLRPLQKRIHAKHGISPEDQKATKRGGYTREELEALRTELGFRDVYYERVALLDYLLWRAHCKFNARWMLALRRPIRWIDRMLARTALMKSQGIALVFGFDT
jgi:SAM-dependent methyltransferase